MKLSHLAAMSLFGLFAPATLLLAQDQLENSSSYYPLKVGSEWTYRTTAGKVTQTVTRHEKIDGTPAAKIEVTIGGKVVGHEHIAVKQDGVYRVAAMGQVVKPPVLFFKLPPKKGETWKVDSTIGGQSLKGTFAIGEESVEVPAGAFENAVTVETEDLVASGQKLPFKYWFAQDVGMVKQVLNLDGQEVVLELESYKIPQGAEKKADEK